MDRVAAFEAVGRRFEPYIIRQERYRLTPIMSVRKLGEGIDVLVIFDTVEGKTLPVDSRHLYINFLKKCICLFIHNDLHYNINVPKGQKYYCSHRL